MEKWFVSHHVKSESNDKNDTCAIELNEQPYEHFVQTHSGIEEEIIRTVQASGIVATGNLTLKKQQEDVKSSQGLF